MKLRGWLWLLGFFLLAGCKPGINSADTQDLAANLNAPFDYYINGMQTQRFSADGKPVFTLRAGRATHFPADDHIELTSPVLHWFRDNAEPWIISADAGNLHHNASTEELTLTGSVKANTSLPQTGNILLETGRLNLWPKDKIALTDAEVKFTTQATRWQSKGMRLNIARNTLSLLNDVRGIYAP